MGGGGNDCGATAGWNYWVGGWCCIKLDPVLTEDSWIPALSGVFRAVGKRTPCCSYLRQRWWSSSSYTSELILYSTSKTWSLGPGQSSMTLLVLVATCFGVLEYWTIGVLAKRKPTFNLNFSFHYSITPPLHHSSRLPQIGKSMGAPSGGSAKPGPLGLDSSFAPEPFKHFFEFFMLSHFVKMAERYKSI